MKPLALLLCSLLLLPVVPLVAQPLPPAREKVILDTDIGDDIDDAYALAMLTRLPNVELLGVTTTFGKTAERATLAAKLLKALGLPRVPVCAGRQGEAGVGRQAEWGRGFASKSLRPQTAVEFLRGQIERYPGQITLIGIGALTNLGDLVTQHPELRSKIRGIVIMGGSVYVGYGGKPTPDVEWNIRCDPPAAKAVFTSGVPLTMAGLEVTAMMQLEEENRKRIYARGTPDTDALAALTALWGGGTPTLFDAVAAAYAAGFSFSDSEKRRVVVENDGLTRIVPGEPNVTVLVKPRKEEFLSWFTATLAQNGARR
ncbi:MAG TPA: nucleoside hydrolase [Armatimonadota bacterium]|jgi:inosine-uridine nucleoside N-ribohydrolase